MNDSRRIRASRRGAVAIATALVMALAVALLVAACGGDDTTDTASPAAASPAAGVTVAGVTITEDPTLSAMLPASVKDAGVLRVATDIPYPPFEMWAQRRAAARPPASTTTSARRSRPSSV